MVLSTTVAGFYIKYSLHVLSPIIWKNFSVRNKTGRNCHQLLCDQSQKLPTFFQVPKIILSIIEIYQKKKNNKSSVKKMVYLNFKFTKLTRTYCNELFESPASLLQSNTLNKAHTNNKADDHIVLAIASLIRIKTIILKYVHSASATNKGENTIHISYEPGEVDAKATSSKRSAKKMVNINRAIRCTNISNIVSPSHLTNSCNANNILLDVCISNLIVFFNATSIVVMMAFPRPFNIKTELSNSRCLAARVFEETNSSFTKTESDADKEDMENYFISFGFRIYYLVMLIKDEW
ncbi:hypothetical protein AGLY_004283 [Aphis glycines]|uniref:Uncharacterized protein n=1 Tax=Aphis glycines TaxID=307491 RepID=A0A6G0TY11_APHGL|nr:hypothetical protein AGLY_004283 [Aphis glycines]